MQRRRGYAGPAVFSYGFRPFFFAAGVWASVGMPLWLPQYFGQFVLPTYFGALDWHIHEMLYGYVAAAVAGFLLTAIPNWTGRMPFNGIPLVWLVFLWLGGRAAILFSAKIGGALAASVDASFLIALACVAGYEIVAAKNWRNLRVVAMLTALIIGNIVFHVEVLFTGTANYGIRIAIAAVIGLIVLVGGRIVPSFTNNWLIRNNPGRLAVPFSRFDIVIVSASALALTAWIAAPIHPFTGMSMTLSGILQSIRIARWAGHRTTADRLVLVLHLGYVFVPIGFMLLGIAAFLPQVPISAGAHAWTAGAIGLMTVAVMTRATLGHTGQPLQAGWITQTIYALILVAAFLRIIAAFNGSPELLEFSGAAWFTGFGCFVLSYGRLLILRSRTDLKPAC
ncbi:MAG TPA: NnrS family protein [Candidatus Acidoferrum sp.]|nr:NnrS family protein [Candidatus Acidoferrum sp.]